MSIRAVTLGIGLALLLASSAYFNDAVIRQTYLVGHFLAPSIFGLLTLLVLASSLMARTGGPAWALRRSEVLVVAALGLAACGWAGNGFLRHFTPLLVTPWHLQQTRPDWQAEQVMSYLPHGSPLIAEGQVRDWPRLTASLRAALADDAEPTPLAEMLRQSPRSSGAGLREAVAAERPTPEQRAELLGLLNSLIAQELLPASLRPTIPDGTDALSSAERQYLVRTMLVASLPEVVMPMPSGQPVLLSYQAAQTSALTDFVHGPNDPRQLLGMTHVPWAQWWPTFRFWLPLLLGVSVATLCLALIVHPQWADRELLPYPIARVIEELGQSFFKNGGKPAWPGKVFFGGFLAMLGLHLLNGAATYVPQLPSIDLMLNFRSLRELFPNASRAPASYALFMPRIYPTIIALSMLISARVSLSLGLSLLLWVAFASFLIGQGVSLAHDRIGGSPHSLMIFGAYVAAMGMILYVGRWYYTQVALSAVAGPRPGVPGYATWAGRILPCAVALMIATLTWGGMHWSAATATVLIMLMLYVVLTRIVAETGAFYLQTHWIPMGILTALFGFDAIGPTTYIIGGIVSMVLALNLRDTLMPHLAHGIYLASRIPTGSVGKVGGWLALVVIATLLLAVANGLSTQYAIGMNSAGDSFATRTTPEMFFSAATRQLAEAHAEGAANAGAEHTGWQRLTAVQWDTSNGMWCLLGLSLFAGTALARLKLPWWPLHPVVFLIWGTRGVDVFAFSFLLGWAVKSSLASVGGTRACNAVRPLAMGVICGEVLAALGWVIFGALYYGWTGLVPPSYYIFPN